MAEGYCSAISRLERFQDVLRGSFAKPANGFTSRCGSGDRVRDARNARAGQRLLPVAEVLLRLAPLPVALQQRLGVRGSEPRIQNTQLIYS